MTTDVFEPVTGDRLDTPWLPQSAPLLMPEQDFWRAFRRRAHGALVEAEVWQLGLFAMATGMAIFGGVAAWNVLAAGGVSLLELSSLILFQILFTWIAYALASALIGFGVSLGGDARRDEDLSGAPLKAPLGRTAILMPVHNEEPTGVCTRLRNMDAALREAGAGEQFHFFLLSDTRDMAILQGEQAAFARLRSTTGQEERLFYRRRDDNHGRKAGNIADWVRNFGAAYDYMVVLDADSAMDAPTLLHLGRLMDQQPRTGLIQTVPRLVNRKSLFGRVTQFASRLYGPMLSDGLAHTCGAAGNYWGHNAIIRVEAFASHAGLPRLEGPKPWGGEIMSHDFVEAALLRRGGWDVKLEPQLEGSYEECPPSLPSLIVRERRWCQGNLQHLPLIGARGLHWMSRVHLAQGVLTYLMPPVWLLFLLVGAARSAEATYIRGERFDDYTLDMLKWLLAISLLSLFIPRGLALIRAFARHDERRAWGNPAALAASVVLEAVFSALIAPILMVSQVTALIDILIGRDSGWSAQQRDDGSLDWGETAKRFLPHTLFGVLFGIAAFIAAPEAALWSLPVVAGLIFSIPIAVLTADPEVGAHVELSGFFVTPEERRPPTILAGLTTPTLHKPSEREWRGLLDGLFAADATVEVADT